jgi:phospholipid-binding lipoprotein MlaA
MRVPDRLAGPALSLLLLLGLAACGGSEQPPADSADAAEIAQENDPWENTNRFFYHVDDAIDRYSLKPIAQAYVFITPLPVRNGLHNFLDNLSSPALFANDVAEAKPRRAGDTFMRFLINSTVGVVGVFDVAKEVGYKAHDADANITLALWGVPSGPFLYLPVLGPNSPRGVVGFAVDQGIDPFNYVPRGYGLITFNWARFGMGAIDTRSRLLGDLDKIKANALDPYATFRSLYRQHVQSQIDAVRNDDRSTTPNWYSP